jgi:hypothetical protein
MGEKTRRTWGISDQSNQMGEKQGELEGLAINQIKWVRKQ